MCQITAVEVGGVKVTQEVLERFFALAYPKFYPIPDGYAPSLEKFSPHDGEGEPTHEQRAYELLGRADMVGAACRACAKSKPYVEPMEQPRTSEQLRTRAQIVTQCHLPQIATKESKPNEAAAAWASRYLGAGTPWLWILGGTEIERIRALADIAVAVAHAMDSGAVRPGKIAYYRTFDLCETVNSSKGFADGKERTKWDYLNDGPLSCDLLLLDGFGRERMGAHELETISQVIGARWRNELPTVIASNAGLAQWVEAHDRAGHTGAHEVMAHILSAMGGYASDQPSREALSASLIDLTANRRKAQP